MVQFREYEWQPAPPGTTARYYDISIPQSPLTIQNRTFSRNAVPSGIVASRVLFLQKTGQSKPDVHSGQSPSLSAKHRRSSSRTGFGRRLTNRFGQPAVINTKPDEEALAVDTSHTFAGLNIPRKNHTEHHAFADSQLRISRSSTQIQLLAQAQDGAGGSDKALWKSKSYNPVRRTRNSLDLDVSREVDPSGNHKNFITQTTIFPLPPNADVADMSRQEIQSHAVNTMASDNSITTTSTIRRQSVRDLFEDYGIDRPAGLVSKHTSRESENTLTLNTELQGKCHLCAWINSDPYTSCWRCGHKVCLKCEDNPGRPTPSRLQKFPSSLDILKPNISPRDMRAIEEPIKQTRLETTPLALNDSLANAVPTRAPSSILPKFPALYEPEVASKLSRKGPVPDRPPLERSLREQASRHRLLAESQTTTGPNGFYEPQKFSRKIPLPEIPLREKLSIPLLDRTPREQSSRVTLLTGSQTTTKVKESPFLIADVKTPQQSLRPVSIEFPSPRSNTRNSHRIPHRQSTECQNGCIFPDLPSPDGASREDINDPAKEEKLLNRAPSRKAHKVRTVTSRSAEKQGQRVYDGTDTGYIADTSMVDEGLNVEGLALPIKSKSQTRTQFNTDSSLSTDTMIIETDQLYPQAQSRFQERVEYYSAKPTSSPVPRKHSGSSQLWNHLSTMQNSEVPEFVECHGYPRTGHTRHTVSPVGIGMVGECQHCLDDCPCAACQNTDHSVRCCTHVDHQAIPHIHNTLSKVKETPTQGLVDFTPSISTESNPQPESLPLSPRTSIAAASFQGQTQNTQESLGKSRSSKRCSLPRSQASKCRKHNTQPRNGQDSIVSQTTAYPRASIVDASLNVGKSKPALPSISTDVSAQNSAAASPTGSSRPIFKEHNIFSQPSRIQDADNVAAAADPNISWISELVDPNMREKPGNFTFPSRKKTKVTGVYSREYVVPEGSKISSTSTSLQPKKSEVENRMGQKLPQNQEPPKETTTPSAARVDTNGEQEEVSKKKLALAAVIPPRRSSLASYESEKKLKLKLIDRKVTPVDGQVGSEAVPRLLVKENRALSSFSSHDTFYAGSRPGSTSGEVDHACVWRSRYENGLICGQPGERESKDINITGVTVVLHLEGREDLIIKAESWKGGRLSVDAGRAGGG